MYVYDEEGNEYHDFFGGIAVNSTGNCNKKVAAARYLSTMSSNSSFVYPLSLTFIFLSPLYKYKFLVPTNVQTVNCKGCNRILSVLKVIHDYPAL